MNAKQLKVRLGAFKFYLLVVISLLAAVYLGFEFGNQLQQLQRQEISTLRQSVANLKQENETLTRDLNVLGVELEVQRLAAQRSQQAIKQNLTREAELRQQLAFYQKVMAPELNEGGFSIEAFDVASSHSAGFYRFELVLMQQNKIRGFVKGSLTVHLQGSEGGQPKTYRLINLMPKQDEPLTFGFKYFQSLNGMLQVPDEFVPEQVVIKAQVYRGSKKQGDLSRTFPWQFDAGANQNT